MPSLTLQKLKPSAKNSKYIKIYPSSYSNTNIRHYLLNIEILCKDSISKDEILEFYKINVKHCGLSFSPVVFWLVPRCY